MSICGAEYEAARCWATLSSYWMY